MHRIASAMFITLLLTLAIPAAAKPKVAVLPMAAVRVEESIVIILNDIMTSEVAGLGSHDVISSKEIDAMLGMEKMKSALGCDDVACLADIGGALGADLMLTGSVGRLGSTLSISLTLFDMRSMKVERRVRQKVEAKEDLYESAMITAVKKLFGLIPPDSETIQGSAAAPAAPARSATAPAPTTPAPQPAPTTPTAPGPTTPPASSATVDADPGWASGASTAGWVLGALTLALGFGSDVMYNISDGSGSAMFAFGATLVGGVAVPIIAAGGTSAKTNPGVVGAPALRTTGWVSYGAFWVAAISTFVYRINWGGSPFFAVIPGLIGFATCVLFAFDASAAADQANTLKAGNAPVSVRILPTLVPVRERDGGHTTIPGLALVF